MISKTKTLLATTAAATLLASAAWADDQAATPAPAPAAPAAPAAPSPPPYQLGMDGPLTINPKPLTVSGGFLGNLTINGTLSGMAFTENNKAPGTEQSQADLTNAQIFIEKTDGLIQYFVDVGEYSFPTVGVPYTEASKTNSNTFGPIPVAYLKIQPTASFSVQVGKLPTLIGAEYGYTFENFNIERGLIWNQENIVNRGVQLNYTKGAWAFNLSVNDGYYSDAISWITGLATWTINASNTLAFDAGGPFRDVGTNNSATSPVYNNSTMYNVAWTHTMGQWTFIPNLQYTSVPNIPTLGVASGSTFGGALYVSYAFPSASKLNGVTIPARFEYVSSSGASSNLLGYGSKSDAWSLTVTPTYQFNVYYIRAEIAYVEIDSGTPGLEFGDLGTDKSQVRGLVEIGAVF